MVNSLALQRLGLCAFTAKGVGSILGQGSEILQVVWYGEKKKAPRKLKREMAAAVQPDTVASWVETKLLPFERTAFIYIRIIVSPFPKWVCSVSNLWCVSLSNADQLETE